LPPPTGAAASDPKPLSNDGSFDFSRFGVRVPTILVSYYLQSGTVFCAPTGQTPFDHTSILATLRDWLNLDADPKNPFPTSPRIKGAPTLDVVLTLDDTKKNTNWPDIIATCTIGDDDKSLQTPLNGLQQQFDRRCHPSKQRQSNRPGNGYAINHSGKKFANIPRRSQLDSPAFLRHSKTGQTNRLELNLDGHALNGRS
jgi:hypothetical protein